jgi:hypothetical protein
MVTTTAWAVDGAGAFAGTTFAQLLVRDGSQTFVDCIPMGSAAAENDARTRRGRSLRIAYLRGR